MATDRLRAIGDRLWGSFSAAAAGTTGDTQELEDDGLEMQVSYCGALYTHAWHVQ